MQRQLQWWVVGLGDQRPATGCGGPSTCPPVHPSTSSQRETTVKSYSSILGRRAARAGGAGGAESKDPADARTRRSRPAAAITAADLETRLYIFAADSMEGRETGTRGHVRATDYIDAQVESARPQADGRQRHLLPERPGDPPIARPGSTISAPGVTLTRARTSSRTGRGGTSRSTRRRADHLRWHAGRHDGRADARNRCAGKIIAYRAPAGAGRGRGGFAAVVAAGAVAATARVRRWRARRRTDHGRR